jgi:hypothetical protein
MMVLNRDRIQSGLVDLELRFFEAVQFVSISFHDYIAVLRLWKALLSFEFFSLYLISI